MEMEKTLWLHDTAPVLDLGLRGVTGVQGASAGGVLGSGVTGWSTVALSDGVYEYPILASASHFCSIVERLMLSSKNAFVQRTLFKTQAAERFNIEAHSHNA